MIKNNFNFFYLGMNGYSKYLITQDIIYLKDEDTEIDLPAEIKRNYITSNHIYVIIQDSPYNKNFYKCFPTGKYQMEQMKFQNLDTEKSEDFKKSFFIGIYTDI